MYMYLNENSSRWTLLKVIPNVSINKGVHFTCCENERITKLNLKLESIFNEHYGNGILTCFLSWRLEDWNEFTEVKTRVVKILNQIRRLYRRVWLSASQYEVFMNRTVTQNDIRLKKNQRILFQADWKSISARMVQL